ncbi:MAG: WxcM-like domain-containing protein [Solirubrobacterales bacterium]
MSDTARRVQPSPKGAFVHPAAVLEATDVGEGTRVWAFAHVLPDARIGRDVNICDHVFIENDVVIGDRVTIKSGVQLWDGMRVEEDVFIGPNATFANDPFPRSRHQPPSFTPTYLRRGCSIGAGATVLPGVTVGQKAMVGAGAVVTRDTPPFAVVVGNPARIRGYVDTEPRTLASEIPTRPGDRVDEHPVNRVAGVRLLEIATVEDLRGKLSFAEIGEQLPFEPRRYFVIHDVPTQEVRGEHAHRRLEQLLVCLEGSVSVVVDDGSHRAEVVLDAPSRALYVPPMVWSTQYGYTRDAVLMVLASKTYDAADYIRDYDEFKRAIESEQRA